jgi:hypothetical protein
MSRMTVALVHVAAHILSQRGLLEFTPATPRLVAHIAATDSLATLFGAAHNS